MSLSREQARPADGWSGPSPRLRDLRRGEALVAVVVFGAALAVLAALTVGSPGVVAAVLVALLAAVLGWWQAGRLWEAWGYAERADDLLIRRGVLIRRLSVIPYGRMQFVDVVAGPIDRRLGLAAVHLHTASAATDAHVPGLGLDEAERLRDRLAALGEARQAGL